MDLERLEKEIIRDFYKWRGKLFIADQVISVLTILLFAVLRPDYLIFIIYLLAIPYLILSQRTSLLYPFAVATLISFVWIFFARNQYAYNYNFIVLWKINLFPFFAWAMGLFSSYLLYLHYEHILIRKIGRGFIKMLAFFSALYLPLLILVEDIGYNFLDIHNLAAANYSGLPFCNCLHGPAWMKLAYFLIGPLFFTICYFLRIENPHIKMYNQTKKLIREIEKI